MNYRFNFKNYPTLLKIYEKYKQLELKATKYSMKNSKLAGRQLEKANQESNEYAFTILAKEVFDTFSVLKPMLHKRRGESAYLPWDEVFNKPFDDLDINQRKCLVGLLDGNYVYELPLSYYND